jgi:hypothetical protein
VRIDDHTVIRDVGAGVTPANERDVASRQPAPAPRSWPS